MYCVGLTLRHALFLGLAVKGQSTGGGLKQFEQAAEQHAAECGRRESELNLCRRLTLIAS